MPFGEQTEAAYTNYLSIKSKVEDYFIRCRLAAFDAQSTEALNIQVASVQSISANDLSKCMDEIAAYPLSKIEANKALFLSSGINPAWEKTFVQFKSLSVNSIFPGKESLTELEWETFSEVFAAYAKWISEKEGLQVLIVAPNHRAIP